LSLPATLIVVQQRRQLAEKEQELAFLGKAAAYFAKGHK
jgi:transposase-like protein